MAEIELHPYEIEQRRNIQIIKNAIPRVGLTEDVLKDLGDICLSVRQQVPDFDRNWWLSVSRYVKANALQLANTTGESIFMERYYNACLFEAPDIFESYMIFTESGRPFEKQFYAPRVRPLRRVADALQGLEDRKYEFLGVSEPPRTGKALAFDTPVLTRDGWKNHGDLTTEDEVIGLDGKFKKVLAVHNPCRMEYRVNFSDGESIVCHGNHEWYVFDRHAQKLVVIETKRMIGNETKYFIPGTDFRIESIEPVDYEVWGNCITVEGGIYLVGKTLKPTHNSTICIFFLSWIIGKRPNSHNAMAGHSGFLADGFYEEILTLTTSSEYRFLEVFPNAILESKSAEKNEANYGERDRFPTFVARGIDGTWTGEVDISPDGYLYVDDLVRDRTESLNPRRLETRYQDYLNVLVDRKNDGSRELMVGTRWNVQDPLGRVEQAHKDDPRYHFLKLPALDENEQSNFDYPIKGFSTKYYLDMRSRLDKPEWEAKYQQRPFIREGLLFPADELRYYNGTLPEGDFRVVSACDVAWGSGDSLSMPVGYEYENGDVYIPRWVFSKGVKEVTLPEVTGAIISEGIKQINFEANAGGDMYAQYVSEMLEGQGYRCAVTHSRAPSTMDKMTKIIASSGNIKRRYVFLDAQHQDEEYRAAMAELNMFVQIGKNEHDDAADGLSQLDRFLEGQMMATVEPMRRRF